MTSEPTPVHADHQRVAWKCQAEPGTEFRVEVYSNWQSAGAIARRIGSAHIGFYRPAGAYEASAHPCQYGTAVWARYVAGLGLEPLPTTMTVRVPDYGRQAGYEGVRIAEVEISARCQVCGGPRGEARPDTFVRDGAPLVRDAWMNSCGHADDYAAVLEEARQRAGLPRLLRREPEGRELKGVEGGEFAAAVDLIAEALTAAPHTRAKTAARFLEDQGHPVAAAAIRAFVAANVTGGQTSARGAALYLNRLDTEGGTK